MTYQEVNPTDWVYSEEGDFIEGKLLSVQEDVGVNKAMLYSIDTPEGVKSVWGATILDSRMALVNIGDQLKITFLGKSKEKKGGKNPAKLFKVEVDKPEN